MTHQSHCRICGSALLATFANLGVSPIANDLVNMEHASEGAEKFYPLNAMVCNRCWLVQLNYSHPASDIFTDKYPYYSSYSETWVTHAATYARQMVDRFDLTASSRVVEVASNDGYLLRHFKSQDIDVLGVEPCENVASAAQEIHSIPTICKFFGVAVGRQIAQDRGHADLMVANNVLAHVPDTLDFLGGFKELLAPNGVVTFEFPHLLELMNQNQFDTIYHEHYCYLSLLAVKYALAKVGLRPYDVERLGTHGGSLRLFVCHVNATHQSTTALEDLEREELNGGLDREETYSAFQERVRRTKRALLSFLIRAKDNGNKIVGYGAPAKGNTLLNFCGIGTDFLDFTVDISPHKQGLLLPGSRIPIYDPSEMRKARPDYVLILPWNLSTEIAKQHSYIDEWGGKFVVPIPEVKVI